MTTTNTERRIFETRLEVRAVETSQAPMIAGHAAVFNQFSVDMGGWVERMRPGAFANSITVDDIRALWNHDTNWVLGRNKAGTLRLSEDAQGLAIEIDPPEAQWAQDLMVSIRRGDVSQQSISFWTLRDQWSVEGNLVVRDVYEVKLFDVSPVTAAAYEQTDVGVRNSELYELSTRMSAGRATAGELSRLDEVIAQLNGRQTQAGEAGAASDQAGLAMRLRLLGLM